MMEPLASRHTHPALSGASSGVRTDRGAGVMKTKQTGKRSLSMGEGRLSAEKAAFYARQIEAVRAERQGADEPRKEEGHGDYSGSVLYGNNNGSMR